MELAWSYILDYENRFNPFAERRHAVSAWKSKAVIDISAGPVLPSNAKDLLKSGIRPKGALHVASALAAQCNVFLTTDDLLLRRARDLATIRVMNLLSFIMEAP